MSKDNSSSLFRRLNRLFKGGPKLRRKISTADTTMAVTDKTKSSGVLLFQKSMSPTYATITSNAYNLSERLMRYQDFQEMEYSLSIDTKIATTNGFKTIGELVDECKNDPDYTFIVYSYDHEKKQIVPAFGKQARQTCVDHAWKVTFDNGKSITASPEHRLMLRDGTYRKVEDLQPGDAMMPFYRKDLFENAQEGTKGYRWVYTMNEKFSGWTKEHQLIAEWVAGRQLTDDEVVHHINFDKTDNRPENLRIMSASDHNSLHAAINNDTKWSDKNHEWIEQFKTQHAKWMRDNAPTRRRDVTFARILETAERVGFSMPAISEALDVSWNLIYERLTFNGFSTFKQFVEAYSIGQKDTLSSSGRPGLLTRDLSLELIKNNIVECDTKRSLSIKLGCTVNVLDKFLNRRLGKSWKEIRLELGLTNSGASVANNGRRSGGRPKGTNGNALTYKNICDAMEPGLTLPRLAEKLNVNKDTIISRLAQHGHKRYAEFSNVYENCKVISVEYVGEIPLYDLTVDGYKNFATDSVISHNTPELAAALDIYCLAPETIIPLLDGTKLTVKELFESKRESFGVYSFDNENNKFVPGHCTRVLKTGTDQQLFKLLFDDGTYVRLTENHLVLLTNGTYKRVKDLCVDDSIRSMYTKISSFDNGDKIDGYEQVLESNGWVYTHRLVAEYSNPGVKGVVHHCDFNKRNNEVNNLQFMSRSAHQKLHSSRNSEKCATDKMYREKMSYKKRYVHVNHKIVSIEPDGKDDVFDLQVDQWHNFAIATESSASSCIIVHNSDETVPQDEKGRILHVYSENEKIKEILEDLFYNVLNVDFNLRPWVRNLVKYGDFFLYVDVSPEYGVMNAFPIPVNEIEREENYDREDPFAVRFRWVTLGNRTLENWEVAHFRLLGNDMFLPYGSSVVEPARRIWRQLILIEDAMLVYRVVRAPERRVFYIDIGNIPPDEVENYIEQQKQQLRSSQVIDRDTGKVDLRYNPLPVHKDTPIPLLDGRTITIEALAKEKESDPEKDQWVYSVQDQSQKLVPGKVIWCGKNYTAKKLVKVWLDDGTYVMTAPEHPFVLRDGTGMRADELVEGDRLMPLYRNVDENGYEQVYSPGEGMFKPTHQIVARDVYPEKWKHTKTRTVHHKAPWEPNNKLNNAPNNLEIMTIWEHRQWHANRLEYTLLRPDVIAANSQRLSNWNKTKDKKDKVSKRNKERNSVAAMSGYNGSDLHREHNENRRQGQKKSWGENATSRKNAMQWVIPDEMFDFICETVKQNPKWGRSKVHDVIISNDRLMSTLAKSQTTKRDVKKFSFGAWEGDLKRRGFEKLTGLRKSIVGYKNHKVAKVEFLDVEGEDVYCMTVVGPNGEDDRHNFAACSVNDNGAQVVGIILKNSVDEDYFIPVRGQDTGTKIDTLAGGQNTAAVEDVEYIQKKMIGALKIPRAYLGYEDALCLSGDTRVPLLTGDSVELYDLAQLDWSKEQDIWVYSRDLNTGKVIPGRVKNAWATKQVTELYYVTLDNGEIVRCTGNHPFLCRDGIYIRADELQSGTSLMPVYRKLSSKKEGDKLDGYEMIWQNGQWQYTHKLVNEHMCDGNHTVKKARVVHHIDCNKLNNNPTNLQEMSWADHRRWHQEHLETTLLRPDVIAKREPIRIAALKSQHHRDAKSVQMKAQHTDINSKMSQWVHGENIKRTTSQKMKDQWADPIYRAFKSKQNKEVVNRPDVKVKLSGKNHWVNKQHAEHTFDWLVDYCRSNNVTELRHFYNNKKTGVPIGERFLMRLLKENGYTRWRDFAINYINRNHKVVNVDVVEMTEPIWVYDLEVENYHNFLIQQGVQVHNSSKATLAQEDIRFSRTINAIQKTIVAELNKIAVIHLYAHGYTNEDLMEFSLRLTSPSTIAEQQKLELWRARFEIAGSAPEGMLQPEWIMKNILNMTDKEIRENISADSDDAAGGGGGGGGGSLGGGFGGGDTDFDLGGDDAGGDTDFDLGGDDAGGDTDFDLGGDGDTDTGEEDEEITAGVDEDEPGTELLTSGEDQAKRGPIKPTARAKHNRKVRHAKSGRADIHMPDFHKMVKPASATQVYDKNFFRTIAKKDILTPISVKESEHIQKTMLALAPDMISLLARMNKEAKIGSPLGQGAQTNRLINEGIDVQNEIDESDDNNDVIEGLDIDWNEGVKNE